MAEADNPTPESHRQLYLPPINWTNTKWKWPFSKLGYEHPEVLFTSLHTEFNCMPLAIQDPYAWYSDVCELAVASKNKDDFEAILRERRDKRFREICETWRNTKEELTVDPRLWESPQLDRANQWGSFVRLARHFSYDCILAHFANYLPDHHMPAAPALKTSAHPAEGPQEPERPEQHQQAEQPPQPDQPMPNSPPPPPPPPPLPVPAPAPNTKEKWAGRTNKGPGQRGRVEKPSPKQRATRSNAQQAVRRSARLQQREGHRSK
ncbi:hypothetical protein F5Y10DRAFT_286524 [Nemania abortiva]|nr:hypothetical protein F5Y10DRAFT_286524 [Nemania abortiva]